MEKYFIDKQVKIDKLTKELEDRKYVRLCFIDFIDNDAKFQVDDYGVTITISKSDIPSYTERAKYYQVLSQIYDSINESLDKIKIKIEPYNIEVIQNRNSIKVTVDIKERKASGKTTITGHILYE